jgi:hypothetical protein
MKTSELIERLRSGNASKTDQASAATLLEGVAELEERAAAFEGSFNACEKELAALEAAIKQAKREALLEAAEFYPDEPAYYSMENPNTFQDGSDAFRNELRRMAEELK